MRNTIRLIALIGAIMVVAALGVTAYAANSGGGTPTPVATVSPNDDPTMSPSSSDGNDVEGNCDEAEHSNDTECQGVTPVSEDDPNDDGDVEDHDDGDVEDQADGDVEDQADDNSGPSDNSGNGNGDDEDEDNSGPGGGDEDEDDSGSSGGDD